MIYETLEQVGLTVNPIDHLSKAKLGRFGSEFRL
jgi:hypothetical protein